MKTLEQLIDIFLPVFNEHMILEHDNDLIMNKEQAKRSTFFKHWCCIWGDDERGDLYELLKSYNLTINIKV